MPGWVGVVVSTEVAFMARWVVVAFAAEWWAAVSAERRYCGAAGADESTAEGRTTSGFAPRVNRFAFARFHNRFAFARFHRFHNRRFFAFAAAPFVAGVGLYGGSCWSWQPTPWGWQRVWACDYDYGYY